MKTLMLCLLLASSAVTRAQGDTPKVDGKWKVHVSVAGNDSDIACTFAQAGADLSGTCTPEDGGPAKLTGKFDGTKITWTYNGDYNGTALTMTYTGTYTSGKIAGSVTVDPFGISGDFTAAADK